MSELTLNNIVIQSRESDHFINATQMCAAGGKEFKHWNAMESTQRFTTFLRGKLQKEIGRDPDLSVIDVIRSGPIKTRGTWIHPDLAVKLAQWVSDEFAFEVSRWVRQLFATGSVSIGDRKSDAELKEMEQRAIAAESELEKIKQQKESLQSFVENIQMLEKNQIFYIATSESCARANRFKYGGVKSAKDLGGRLNSYNTGRPEADLMYFCHTFKCHEYRMLEDRLGSILRNFKDKTNGRKEMVHIHFNALVDLISFLEENYDREVEFINEHCQEFLNRTVYSDAVVPPPIADQMEVTIRRRGVVTRTETYDITKWSDEKVNDVLSELVTHYAREEKKLTEYSFQADKDIVALELTWKLFAPYMKVYTGIKMTEWRSIFKKWFSDQKPRRLALKGVAP